MALECHCWLSMDSDKVLSGGRWGSLKAVEVGLGIGDDTVLPLRGLTGRDELPVEGEEESLLGTGSSRQKKVNNIDHPT